MNAIADGSTHCRPDAIHGKASARGRAAGRARDGAASVGRGLRRGPPDGARTRKIDLASLSIAALIEAFAAALQAALADPAGVRLEHWAAWTVTAATPTELWSRLKLPGDSLEVRAAAAEAGALHEQIASRALMLAAAD